MCMKLCARRMVTGEADWIWVEWITLDFGVVVMFLDISLTESIPASSPHPIPFSMFYICALSRLPP